MWQGPVADISEPAPSRFSLLDMFPPDLHPLGT
jgi:hypothetical protein